LLVVPVANALGLQGLPLFFVAGALVSLLLFRHVPESPGGDVVRERMRWREISWQSMRILGLLQFIAVARAFVITGIGTFLPIYMHQKGFSLFFAGATATLFQGIGSLGGLLGGHLSDIFSRSRMMQIPLLLVAPCLLAFFFLDGWIRFVCLAAGGVALYLSLPLNVVMAIELFPRHAGTVSALIIGFAWGIGALLLTPFGLAAERFGLEAAMIGLTLLSLTAVAAAFLLTDNISKTKKELVRA
jgi:FSR family fosmidomycin resistance protein-like MFS transporter